MIILEMLLFYIIIVQMLSRQHFDILYIKGTLVLKIAKKTLLI